MSDDTGVNARLEARFKRSNSGRRCVGQQRRDTERVLRLHRERQSNARKVESNRRRALPETKCDKLEKKWQAQRAKSTRGVRSYTCRDVQTSHRQIMEGMGMTQEDHRLSQDERAEEKARMDVYISNYEAWTTSKSVQMSTALAEDERNRKKAEQERELKARESLQNRHKRAMSETLKEIAADHKGVVSGAKKRFKTLTGYFVTKSGDNERKLLYLFNKFYFSSILGSSVTCYTFPEYEPGDDESDEDAPVSNKYTNMCHVCHRECIVDSNLGDVVCTKCGVSRTGGVGVGIKQTFNEAQASTRSGAPYVRSSHFREFINRLENSEKTVVPEEVINACLRYCRRKRIDPMATPDTIHYNFLRKALSETNYATYFENIPQIRKRLTNLEPPKFSSYQREQLEMIFTEIQQPFERHKGKRKNFLSYAYTTYKSCELLGYTEFMPFLPLLKAHQNLQAADKLWKKICEDLQYEFVPTVPYI